MVHINPEKELLHRLQHGLSPQATSAVSMQTRLQSLRHRHHDVTILCPREERICRTGARVLDEGEFEYLYHEGATNTISMTEKNTRQKLKSDAPTELVK